MDELIKEIKKMSNLLALVLTKDQDTLDSVVKLSLAGYSQSDIATILGTTKKAIEMILYRNRKTKKVAKNA